MPAPVDSREALETFLGGHGLEHVHRLAADVLVAHLPEPLRPLARPLLARLRWDDAARPDGLARLEYALARAPGLLVALPAAIAAFLEAEARSVALARADVPERLSPPAADGAHAAWVLLARLRALHAPHLAPRERSKLGPPALELDLGLPGFRWNDDRAWVSDRGQLERPRVTVVLDGDASRVACNTCAPYCVHTLAAVDAALAWVKDDAHADALAELQRPAWQRALDAMDAAAVATAPEQVTWRLHVHDAETVSVEAWLHRLSRKGTPSAGTRIAASTLLEEHASTLSPEDQRLAALLAHTFASATQPLLLALVGRPNVVLRDNPHAKVTVELGRVGLLADHRGNAVVLVPALDGTPLPPGTRFFFEESSRRLTVLEEPEEVRAALAAVERFGNQFPPESHPALVEKLSTLATKVPVAMPRTVMGELVPPRTDVVLRIELLEGRALRATLRVRPLPECAAVFPGEGPRDVHVRRAGKPLHARRDLKAEVDEAERWRAKLPFPALHDELGPFTLELFEPQRALAFLAALEARGRDVPELEWLGERPRLAGHAQASALKVHLRKKREWFGVTGGLTVAGERMTLAVLLDAARRKDRFVPLGERGFVELSEALRRQLDALALHARPVAGGFELGPSSIDAVNALLREGAQVDADADWERFAAEVARARRAPAELPRGLQASLRDYQRQGFEYLMQLSAWGAGGVLADDMGLGKTVQALAVLLARAKVGPSLVVAPTSVGFNWVAEARRFAPSLRVHVHADTSDRRALVRSLRAGDVLLTSYGLLANEVRVLEQRRFGTVVFDEAQALKNPGTHRAQAARKLTSAFTFALTGTPLENHLGELWSLYRVVFPSLLGSWTSFRDRFAAPIEQEIDPAAAPALSRLLEPFLLRRTKQQVANELPRRTELRVPVVLSPEEFQHYEDARLSALSDLESKRSVLREQERKVEVLAALTRLRLLASHPRLHDPRHTGSSSKLERFLELSDELRAEGHRALVFSQFTSHLALVREALDARGVRYEYLDGQTPRKERAVVVRRFQAGDAPLFLISLQAGGAGLNLTAADNVIHLDPWWNPAVEDQASDRAHRIGQTKPVTIYRLVAMGTIEEQILALHASKRRLVDQILRGQRGREASSSAALMELLRR
ncbi:MAG: DEAD/DEAH box helicase [Myxococcaceae bacterium]|nr:DEAD/DEAH box helicase [Myxococcaceae bacterium]